MSILSKDEQEKALSETLRTKIAAMSPDTIGAPGYIGADRLSDGTLSYTWHGGNTVWITFELLRAMGIERPASDTNFTFGPFALRCTMHRIKEQLIEAVRIANEP